MICQVGWSWGEELLLQLEAQRKTDQAETESLRSHVEAWGGAQNGIAAQLVSIGLNMFELVQEQKECTQIQHSDLAPTAFESLATNSFSKSISWLPPLLAEWLLIE